MSDQDSKAGPGLQFDRAEPISPQAAPACATCRRSIELQYFEAAGHVLCPACAAQHTRDPGWGGALRAGLYGAGAALAGTIAWFLIMKLTKSEFGLLAIGVGLLVGIAVRKGARGAGGWKYQALAMGLTYLSITTSYVPLIVGQMQEQQHVGKDAAGKPGVVNAGNGEATAQPPQAPAGAASGEKPAGVGSILFALVLLLGIAVASPFLAGASNFMGIVIIGIALYEAWKINKRIVVSGPFEISPAVAVAPAVAEIV
jgi:hypothetical protein